MKLLTFAATVAMTLAAPAMACDEGSGASAQTEATVYAYALGAFAPQGVTSATITEDNANSTITIVSDEDGRRVEIKIVGDDVQAKVDGKEVPQDRIRRDARSISILDENGEAIYSTNLYFGEAPVDFAFAFGGNEPFNAYQKWLFQGEVETPNVMLGVHMESAGPALEKQLKLKPGATTLITGVYEGLPASAAGIEEYDVIVAVDGSDKADPESIRALLKDKEPGDVMQIEVVRAGEHKTLSVTLEKYDAARMNKATLHGAASASSTARGFFVPGQNGTGAVIFDPLRNSSLAAVERLRERMGKFGFEDDALREQIGELQSRVEDLQKMVEQMVEQQAAQQPRPLKDNES